MKRLKFGLIICGILLVGAANANNSVIYDATQDDEDIAAAKEKIEGVIYKETQTNVTNIEDAKSAVEAIIAELELNDVKPTVVDGVFTAAIAEVDSHRGTDGSYTFTVKLNKGDGAEQTTDELTLIITATPYNAPQDDEDIRAAKEKIESEIFEVAEMEANTEVAVKTWLVGKINNLIAEFGITVTEEEITMGEKFTAALDGIDGSFEFSVLLLKDSASDKVNNSGSITATPNNCPPQTCIMQKGTSNILICEDATQGIQYLWGFIERSTQKEETIESEYANYQYFEYPHQIDTLKFEYFVEIKYSQNACSTRSYYPTNQCENAQTVKLNNRINAYPNPTKQQLSVTLDKDIDGSFAVFLRNMLGQTVFTKKYTEYRNNEVLSIDFNLPAGLYVMTIETKYEVLTSKIIIE